MQAVAARAGGTLSSYALTQLHRFCVFKLVLRRLSPHASIQRTIKYEELPTSELLAKFADLVAAATHVNNLKLDRADFAEHPLVQTHSSITSDASTFMYMSCVLTTRCYSTTKADGINAALEICMLNMTGSNKTNTGETTLTFWIDYLGGYEDVTFYYKVDMVQSWNSHLVLLDTLLARVGVEVSVSTRWNKRRTAEGSCYGRKTGLQDKSPHPGLAVAGQDKVRLRSWWECLSRPRSVKNLERISIRVGEESTGASMGANLTVGRRGACIVLPMELYDAFYAPSHVQDKYDLPKRDEIDLRART
ncbi:hypothetical protein PF002_g10075 [Phytophthora fragariae]|uniref:Uncharacterized protein n=1 Tax=Phytophthora fragariae TaxID=53985 RepID=A0A6A3ZNI6_9STRA|nr:hypothetical protein PF002_g10075 [Phytophthora fragariae]